MNTEHAISHRELCICRNSFRQWILSVEKRKLLDEKVAIFEEKQEKRRIKVAIKQWRAETNRIIDLNYLLRIGDYFLNFFENFLKIF